MVQESNLRKVASSDNSPNGRSKILEAILARNPGVDFEIIQFSDGEYVQFHRDVKNGQTSYSTFSFVKID